MSIDKLLQRSVAVVILFVAFVFAVQWACAVVQATHNLDATDARQHEIDNIKNRIDTIEP